MENWKNLFSRKILSRGKFYYDAGNVNFLKKEQNTYSAHVEGSDLYKVTVQLERGHIRKMNCSCPYAWAGMRCKHMAAVMYEIEKREASAVKKQSKKEHLFSPGETSQQYFDIEKLTRNWEVPAETLLKAKQLYSQRIAENLHITEGYHSFFRNSGYTLTARYGDKDLQWDGANLCISNECVLQYSCRCSFKSMTYSPYYPNFSSQPCEHVVMLAWCVRDYILKYHPGDITDFNSSEFLKAFRRKSTALKLSDIHTGHTVKLIPRAEYDGDQMYLSFKIGYDKVYIVKKLSELVDCVSHKKPMTLGKTCELDFVHDRFDDESEVYYELIEKFVNEENLRFQDGLNASNPQNHNRIHLMGSLLDEFYDLFENKNPELVIKSPFKKSETSHLAFSEGIPHFELSIEESTGSDAEHFEGIYILGELPELLSGHKYRYFMDGCCLKRIAPDEYENIKLFYEYSYYGSMNLKIGRKNLSEFYYNVLPVLREYADIDERNIAHFDELIPPEPAFSFYLDAENSLPVCKVLVSYGETGFTPTVASDSGSDIRNFHLESEVMDTVKSYFPFHDAENERFMCSDSEDAVFDILERGVPALIEVGEVHSTNAFNALKIRKKFKISIGVSIESELMNLSVRATDIPPEELIEILKSYRLKKKYHRLRNGNFVSLDENIEKLEMMLSSMKIADKQLLEENIKLPSFRALYLDKMLELCGDIEASRNKRFRQFVKDFKTVNESDYEVPQSLSEIMRAYQHYGHKWLRTVSGCGFGGILADDMGLGKTLQIISVLLACKQSGGGGCSIVICPASLVYNWHEELRRFAPDLMVGVVSGTACEREKIIESYQSYDVLVTSYDLFKRDIGLYDGKTFEYQILDEAQNIKNQSTAASKSVKILKSKKRFALTGTPIENRLSELWSIFDYLMPGYLYSYDSFKKEFETPIVRKQDKDATERLRLMVSPFILRRLKSDVLKELPDKIEEVRYARFDQKQQEIYDGQVSHMKNMLEAQSDDDFSKNKIRILAELTRIRQICCDPSLIFEDYNGESAKRQACIDLITSAIEGNHKILVFSQFTSMFELLEKDLSQNGITYYKITGETDKKQRLELVKKFNSDATNVFLISLKAGGTGLNLTGADVVIHYDPWWNVAAQNQATDRAHRIGQEKVVSVYKLIAKDTVEEKILSMQEKKKELADAVISGNAGQFTSMSKEDILKLLK